MYAECMDMQGITWGPITMTTDWVVKDRNQFCDAGMVGVAMKCRDGDVDEVEYVNCANINLTCRNLLDSNNVPLKIANSEEEGCYWTGEFSEEGFDDGANRGSCLNGNSYLRGLSCSGKFCNSVRMFCCPRMPFNSNTAAVA
jgi:hypothetical protein